MGNRRLYMQAHESELHNPLLAILQKHTNYDDTYFENFSSSPLVI